MDAYSNLDSALQFSGLGSTMTKSAARSSNTQSQLGTEGEDDHASVTSAGSLDEDDGVFGTGSSMVLGSMGSRSKKTKSGAESTDQENQMREDQLNQMVTLTLTETETIWLLDLPSVCVGANAEDEAAVKAANARYQEVPFRFRFLSLTL